MKNLIKFMLDDPWMEGPTREEMRQDSIDAYERGDIDAATLQEDLDAILLPGEVEDDDDDDLPGGGLFVSFCPSFG